jgi:hypothetical protein
LSDFDLMLRNWGQVGIDNLVGFLFDFCEEVTAREINLGISIRECPPKVRKEYDSGESLHTEENIPSLHTKTTTSGH